MYKCICGREFEKIQSYASHCGHCEKHLGKKPIDRFGDSRAWSRGLTKESNETLKKLGENHSKYLKSLGNNNPLVKYNKNKPKRSLENQSKTRKYKYASGELTPAKGVGRGKYSYLEFNNKSIMLRSTYEFIFALYLLYNNIDFEYESIRATYNDRTYISDFLIDNKIIEIKGNYNSSMINQEKAFNQLGYDYEVKFWKDLIEYYNYLSNKIDIENILKLIKDGHDSKNYFHYKFI